MGSSFLYHCLPLDGRHFIKVDARYGSDLRTCLLPGDHLKSWSFPKWASGDPARPKDKSHPKLLLATFLYPQPDFNCALSRPSPAPGKCPFSSPEYLHKGFFSHLHFLRDGRLSLGDELLVINGHLLVGLSHEEAVAILRSATGMVQLVVASKVGSLVIFYIYF